MPLPRWDVDNLPYGGAARFGGWLGDGIEVFDAAAFGIAPQEALLMDAQHRVLLEASAEAIHGACGSSLSPAQLAGAPVAVAIGIASSEYNNWVSSRDVFVSSSNNFSAYHWMSGPIILAAQQRLCRYAESIATLLLPTSSAARLAPALTGAEAPSTAHHRLQRDRGRPQRSQRQVRASRHTP